MPLLLEVRTAYGTSVDKFASEILHLATITQCIISTEFEGMRVSVGAGERVEDIAANIRERIDRHNAFNAKPKTPRV